jgi:hypothetical protein
MRIQRSAVLGALSAAIAIFIVLILATRLQMIASLVIAIAAGGAVLAAMSRSQPAQPMVYPPPIQATPDPPPPQYQAQSIAGIRMPSAREGYNFVFSATVYWLPTDPCVAEPGSIAVREIVRRAREITRRQDPAEDLLAMHELSVVLADALSDDAGRVHARAESVQLQISNDDRRRLDELATLRKDEERWDYQRRHEQSKRRYLGEDVLKDAGSAVVWWLARNEDQPTKVAESISVLSQLANAANNAAGDPPMDVTGAGNGVPVSSAERFGAFMDSLDSLADDARLMLTKQMASLVESHGYSDVAKEMTDQYDKNRDDPGMSEEESDSSDW